MLRYSVGQWAGGAAHRIGTAHPAGEARHWISCRGLTRCIRQPDSYLLCILSCGFQWEASQKSPLVLGPFPRRYQSAAAACRRLQRLSSQLHTRKKLFDLCEFHLAAARWACGRSACTVRQRAIKSRRSGKSRLDGFTLMSCVARKFEGKGEKKTQNTHTTPKTVVFSKCSSPLWGYTKTKRWPSYSHGKAATWIFISSTAEDMVQHFLRKKSLYIVIAFLCWDGFYHYKVLRPLFSQNHQINQWFGSLSSQTRLQHW